VEKVAVIAITKNGIEIGLSLKKKFPTWKIYVPSKFSNSNSQMNGLMIPLQQRWENYSKNMKHLFAYFPLVQ